MKKRIPIPKDVRKLIKSIYQNRCAFCYKNNRRMLQIHHNDRNPENNEIENLILLCVYCHAAEHNDVKIIEWAIKKGLIK